MSDYVRRVRERIGHELLFLAAVAVLVRDDAGRLLLVRSVDSGDWGTVGGAVEIDEAPQDAAKREALEETGVDVTLERLVGCFGGPDFRATYPNGDEVAYVSIVYDARIAGCTPEPDMTEVCEVGWFEDAELRALDIDPFNRVLLKAVGLL